MVKETGSSNLKKKRKTAHADSEIDGDIYKKVIAFEEKEAVNRQSELDANLYFELCRDIKEMLKEVYNQKLAGTATKNSGKEFQTEIFIKLCMIKKLNRIDKIKHVFGKDTMAVEKQKCDSIKLSYQNLVYELHHLVAETNKCLAFKSKDEDIELVPLEDFMKEAPLSLTKKFENYDPQDSEQNHGLRLARLEWELTQRKSLAQLCESLKEEQKKLGQDLVERREKLNALRPLLTNIINSTKPLQEHLDISSNELRVDHKLAHLLPDPLYIFYVNVLSYTNAYDINLSVEILGDQEEATQWKEARESEDSELLEDDNSELEADQAEVEEVVEVKKRRHRKSVQQVDPMEEKKKELLQVHPLSVEITAKLNNEMSLAITFRYQTKLKFVTVISKTNIPESITGHAARDVLFGENILSELVEGDTGLSSPNPITQFQLRKIGVTSFESLVPHIGHAYHWSQRVCGMDFLTKQTNCHTLGSSNVENIIKVLFKRLEAKHDLSTQLQQLEQNVLPKAPNQDGVLKPATTLSKWSSITYQKYCQSEFTQQFIEEDLVSAQDLFYSAELVRGSANLLALIVVKNNYPEVSPIFSLCLNFNGVHNSGNSDEVRELERMVNVEKETDDVASTWILSTRLTNLCSYLDVYLESSDNKTFPQSVTFVRNICGRNRKRPYRFRKMGNGIFTHY